MTINHHLDNATVLAYAAGTLGEALGVAAACHISMCPDCRGAVRKAEALGGEILDGLQVSEVSGACRTATLARLEDPVTRRPAAARGELPPPLGRLLGGRGFAQLRWRKKAPGVAVYELPLSKNARGSLKLISIAPGLSMLEHGHGGGELTLVLKGAFKDKLGRFARGDIADLDQDTEHCPVIEAGETCICLFATEAPTRYRTLIGRLLQPFLGI